MKNIIHGFLTAVIVLFLARPVWAQVDTLTILHFNDTHSNLAPLGPRNNDLTGTRGGIARAATLIGMTKMTEPNVLTLHAGDVFIGDFFFNTYFGAASFQLMNALGFDAMTLGNHEFDLEPTTLEQALAASFPPDSGFSILSSNLIIPPDTLQTLASYVVPFTVKQVGNIKVGIFGMTTPSTNVLSLPAPAVIDTSIIDITVSMVDTLQKQNCDVIIMLSHLGYYLDQAIAENIPGINIIVGGHDHYLFEQPVEVKNPLNETTLIVQIGAFNQYVGKLQLTVDKGTVNFLNFQAIPLDGNIPEDPTVKAQVDGMISEIESIYGPVYSQQIGVLAKTYEELADSLTENGAHDTPVGNLISDAYRLTMGTDIGIEPGGSTAQPLYEGPIVPADIFRTVGYGFNTVNGLGYRIVTFDISGADLWAGLEFGVSEIEIDDEFLIQVSGLKYVYNPSAEPYSRILSIEIGGQPLDPSATYSVAANELVLEMLNSLLGLNVTNVTVQDSTTEFQLLYQYIVNQGNIDPKTEGRIVADNTVGVKNSLPGIPDKFELEQNYPNPFNPSTTINFSIPESGLTKLEVFNALGEKVEVLLNKEMSPGKYSVNWDAAQYPSGVYFYRISTNKFNQVKKMVLLR